MNRKLISFFAMAFLSGAACSLTVLLPSLEVKLPELLIRRDIREVFSDCLTLRKERNARVSCITRLLSNGVAREGITAYMRALTQKINDKEIQSGFHCHDVAHVIGKLGVRTSIRHPKTAIAACTSACGDGCYHGVVEGYLATGGNLDAAPQELCDANNTTSCFHGLGHGIASVTGDLTKSLVYCDRIVSDEGRRQCGYGVFMELFEATTNDHAVLPLPDDLIGFCARIREPYRSVCQSKVGIHTYKKTGDLASVGSSCGRVPDPYDCMAYFGVLMYWQYQQSSPDILTACRQAGEIHANDCIIGAAEESVSIDPNAARALELCLASSDAFRKRCFGFVGDKTERVYGSERRKELCGTLLDADKAVCMEAGL